MTEEKIIEIVDNLSLISEDQTVPKNIRLKIKGAISVLTNNSENFSIRKDKSLEELGNLAEDPNVPPYTKMQIWSIVSQLESN